MKPDSEELNPKDILCFDNSSWNLSALSPWVSSNLLQAVSLCLPLAASCHFLKAMERIIHPPWNIYILLLSVWPFISCTTTGAVTVIKGDTFIIILTLNSQQVTSQRLHPLSLWPHLIYSPLFMPATPRIITLLITACTSNTLACACYKSNECLENALPPSLIFNSVPLQFYWLSHILDSRQKAILF